MKPTAALAALFVALATGAPAPLVERQIYLPCSGLYGTAQCCATDVLGVADLDCGNRTPSPSSASHIHDDADRCPKPPRCLPTPLYSSLSALPLASARDAVCCLSYVAPVSDRKLACTNKHYSLSRVFCATTPLVSRTKCSPSLDKASWPRLQLKSLPTCPGAMGHFPAPIHSL